jgi:hypothetical protein
MGTIGVEWVNLYHGRPGLADLSNNDENARGFYNTLSGTRQFDYGNDSAWDRDFEEQGVGSPPQGTDQLYADNVDIVFFSGHGGAYSFHFGITTLDDGDARNTDIRLGNRQCEWIVLDACQCLEWNGGAVFNAWQPAFAGLHYILGFHTTTSDSAERGTRFAQKLNAGMRVRDAWINACIETEGSSTDWAYLRADSRGTNTFDDHWWGKGFTSPDPVPPVQLSYQKGSC